MRTGVLMALVGAWGLVSCGAFPNDRCRLTPERCQGGPGGLCAAHLDCATERCCQEDACGGGMCTFACEDDAGCPFPMRCREGFCFYDCASADDCADSMVCEEEQGICRYETAQGNGKGKGNGNGNGNGQENR